MAVKCTKLDRSGRARIADFCHRLLSIRYFWIHCEDDKSGKRSQQYYGIYDTRATTSQSLVVEWLEDVQHAAHQQELDGTPGAPPESYRIDQGPHLPADVTEILPARPIYMRPRRPMVTEVNGKAKRE